MSWAVTEKKQMESTLKNEHRKFSKMPERLSLSYGIGAPSCFWAVQLFNMSKCGS